MAINKDDKRKAKKKARLKERREKLEKIQLKERVDFFYYEAQWFFEKKEWEKALGHLEQGLRYDPKNERMLKMLAHLGYQLKRPLVELRGVWGLYTQGLLSDTQLLGLAEILIRGKKYQEALRIIDEASTILPGMNSRDKKKTQTHLLRLKEQCTYFLQMEEVRKKIEAQTPATPQTSAVPASPPPVPAADVDLPKAAPISLPEIDIAMEVDTTAFEKAFNTTCLSTREQYELALEGYQIRFEESFENLISLAGLTDVRSLWYQEETAKKVLRGFRGRALLADEVGLGKTIEALIVVKEYVQRGMVKSALILVPAPLVSQWRDEMAAKFGLYFASTDDQDFRARGDSFWQAPFVLASINIAKSKRHFDLVTEREYDLVIVDEAHHLKNRNTLNWKLVNALKKRFLLLLTATPVENNLMELYNLITLLKPGQLKTATAFRNEFMTRGDPTDPQNRTRLKELLGQVMIRNTRAVAKLEIPSRFAQTIRVEPNIHEQELYERITTLVKEINTTNGTGNRLLLKNILAMAGSSPRAVSQTLTRLLEKREFLLDQEKEITAINTMCRTMDDPGKNRALRKIIKTSPGKMIIFINFMGTLDQVSEFLSWEKIPYALFHGSMDNRQKDEQLRIFREERDILLATEVGGEGRNLQFCHQMVNYDLPWNPMRIEQRIGRIHRIGQEKEVMIYNLCTAGSVEDYILEVLDRKINMFELVIGEIDMILGRVQEEQEFSDLVYDIWVSAASDAEREKLFDQLAGRLKRSKTGYLKTKALDEKLFGESYEL